MPPQCMADQEGGEDGGSRGWEGGLIHGAIGLLLETEGGGGSELPLDLPLLPLSLCSHAYVSLQLGLLDHVDPVILCRPERNT